MEFVHHPSCFHFNAQKVVAKILVELVPKGSILGDLVSGRCKAVLYTHVSILSFHNLSLVAKLTTLLFFFLLLASHHRANHL
jgi:hypothetical protein